MASRISRSSSRLLDLERLDGGVPGQQVDSLRPAVPSAVSSDGDEDEDSDDDLHASGRTPPLTFTTPTPAPAAVRAAADTGVAAAAVRRAANKQVSDPRVHKMVTDVQKKAQKTPVCKYLWRRMLCRRPACAYRHPDLCASPTCIPTRAPNCVKFHGTYKEDKEKDSNADKRGSNPAKRSSQRPAQGNGRRGGPPQNRSSSGRSNNRRFPPSSAPRRGGMPPPQCPSSVRGNCTTAPSYTGMCCETCMTHGIRLMQQTKNIGGLLK